jgi:CDP-diacylglycerol--glycerol-3-phosphate 3-phosphatidyltransferase
LRGTFPKTRERNESPVNLPNQITLIRLILSIVLFGLLEVVGGAGGGPAWYFAFALFFATAGTDWLDGYLARKRKEVTAFGRIADPLVDKIVICGVLILTQTYPETAALVPSWIVLLVVAREFVVSGLRAFIEGQGVSFAASWSGKSKLLVQAFYCGSVLLYPAANAGWIGWCARISLWGTAFLTLLSAGLYVARGTQLLRKGAG